MLNEKLRTPIAGSLHRGPSQRRSSLPNKDPLLFPRPEQSRQTVADREELPRLLPDDGRPRAPGEEGARPGRLHSQGPQVPVELSRIIAIVCSINNYFYQKLIC